MESPLVFDNVVSHCLAEPVDFRFARAPSSANCFAVARPMPSLPPEMSATLPSSLLDIAVLLCFPVTIHSFTDSSDRENLLTPRETILNRSVPYDDEGLARMQQY
jgi:hypothetical protein